MAVRLPSYIHRNFENDLPPRSASYTHQAVRVAAAALPFFSLYKTFSYSLSLAMGAARFITAGKDLWDGKQSTSECAHAAVAAIALAGTIFSHPLGMLIASVHDLALDLARLSRSIQGGDYKDFLPKLLQALNDMLYVGLFLGAGANVVVASLCTQLLVGMHRSWAHLQKGENLEGASHLLMSLIRGHQAIRQCQAICIQKEIQKAQKENKPYLPLANRVQIFFTNAGYRINELARRTIRQLSDCLNPNRSVFSRLQTATKVMLVAPLVLSSFLFSTPCYLLASYTGIGRFERIEAVNPSNSQPSDEIHIMFQNICGQNPWSIFSGGQLPPLEVGPDGKRRVDAILEAILKENPDLYCGQEYDDLDTSRIIGNLLAKQGYTCVRDLGCNDPFFNHSGMFMASRSTDVANSISFTPILPEDTSGITYWSNRGILSADVPMENGGPIKVLNLHFNAGSSPEDHASRLMQLQKYVTPLVKGKRAIAVGDGNLDTEALTESEREAAGISDLENALEGHVTCTDEGKHTSNGKPRGGCDECQEKIDVAIYDPDQLEVSKPIITEGNSDHHAISLQVKAPGKHPGPLKSLSAKHHSPTSNQALWRRNQY